MVFHACRVLGQIQSVVDGIHARTAGNPARDEGWGEIATSMDAVSKNFRASEARGNSRRGFGISGTPRLRLGWHQSRVGTQQTRGRTCCRRLYHQSAVGEEPFLFRETQLVAQGP